jgi:hypothetical protein
MALCLLLLLAITTTSAQTAAGSCPALVEQALAQAGDACGGLGRNQVCYGHNQVTATAWDVATLNDFAAAGDLVNVADVAVLETAPFDLDAGTWGVAILALQANLPDTLPGQNVTFVVYGDAIIENDVSPDSDSNDSAYTAPMQAFRFRTGIGEPSCEEVPEDGILIQAPRETTVSFLANGIDVTVGSTVTLHTTGDTTMRITVLEGEASVTIDGETTEIPTGSSLDVETGDDAAAGEPTPFGENMPSDAMPLSLLPRGFVFLYMPGNADWLDTGLTVSAGSDYFISAAGEVVIWPGCYDICSNDVLDCDRLCPALTTGPAGSIPVEDVVPESGPFMLMPGEPLGALVGRVGSDGAPFVLGAAGIFSPGISGSLFLKVNEDTRTAGDETGGYYVALGTVPVISAED